MGSVSTQRTAFLGTSGLNRFVAAWLFHTLYCVNWPPESLNTKTFSFEQSEESYKSAMLDPRVGSTKLTAVTLELVIEQGGRGYASWDKVLKAALHIGAWHARSLVGGPARLTYVFFTASELKCLN